MWRMIVIALLFIAPVVAWLILKYPGVAQETVSSLWREYGSFVLQVIVGVILANAAYEYGFRSIVEKLRRRDRASLLRTEKESLEKDYAQLEKTYTQLLKEFPKAVGGDFTRSLFEYHPMASKRIAGILSNEAFKLYQKHHVRVIVTTATDSYRITGIKTLSSTLGGKLAWELEFHIEWSWLNDSKTTKHPLGDLLFLVVAPEEALDAFLGGTQADKNAQRIFHAEFFARPSNPVRSTIAHPAASTARIPDDLVAEMFEISRVDIRLGSRSISVGASDLVLVEKADLPPGVYRGYRLPRKDRNGQTIADLPLEVDKSCSVEYRGRIALPALTRPDEAQTNPAGIQITRPHEVYGAFVFPPSDVIESEYVLNLVFPREIVANKNRYHLEVMAERSGCRLLHQQLDHPPVRCVNPSSLPDGFKPGPHEEHMQMKVPGALSDLHQIQFVWLGRLANAIPERSKPAAVEVKA